MNNATKLVLVIIAVLTPVAARAQSLEEKRWRETAEKEFKHALEATNKSCGTTIEGTLDANVKLDEWGTNMHPGSLCNGTNYALRKLCEKADGKEAVSKGIKTLNCKSGPSPKLDLKAGVLDITITKDGKPHPDVQQGEAEKFLLKNL